MPSKNWTCSGFKSVVAWEAIRGDRTVAEIAQKHEIHPGQVPIWKTEALSKVESLLEKKGSVRSDGESQVAALERKGGHLTVENAFLTKSWSGSVKRSGGK